METNTDTKKRQFHHPGSHRNDGYNVKRIREILGVKQEELAIKLKLSQQAVSKMESEIEIDDDRLEEIAQILKVPAEVIRNFSNESAMTFLHNSFKETSFYGLNNNYNCVFHPLGDMKELYERMLQEHKNRIEELEKELAKEKAKK